MTDSSVIRTGMTLAIIAAVCTALVAATYRLTSEKIAANDQAWLEQSLQPVLSGLSFDNSIIESKLTVATPHALPGTADALIYRVYLGDSPVAALFVVSARDGYSGPIRLLIGVAATGAITGVHILDHRETPGLGDLAEAGKSNWLTQFPGRSLGDPGNSRWKVRKDGGEFDQLTGATITPRAIVKAIAQTLLYFETNKTAIFSAQADSENEVTE